MSITDSTQTIFQTNGLQYFVSTDQPSQRLKKLPIGTYLLRFSMEGGFFLSIHEDFELPSKIYGNLGLKADKVLNTFAERPTTTGVHLCGEKGSGKTLLTKLISTHGLAKGIPTIIVNMPAAGDAFNEFVSKIEQPAILLFDEFEKVYDKEQQQALLTLLDGVFASKKLFLLTSNDYAAVNEMMKNRPGRIYYHLDFKGLEPQFIKEYAEDNLKNKKYLENLSVVAGFLKPLNFDMLQAIIEESNRYDESPIDTLDMLNVKINSWTDFFLVDIKHPKRKVIINKDYTEEGVRLNPLSNMYLSYDYKTTPKSKVQTEDIYVIPKNLLNADGILGRYEYKLEDGTTVSLRSKPFSATGIEKFKTVKIKDTEEEDE